MSQCKHLLEIWMPDLVVRADLSPPSAVFSIISHLLDDCANTRSGSGYSINPLGNPYVEACKFAAALAAYAERSGYAFIREKHEGHCRTYLDSLHSPGSGFRNGPDGPPLVFPTYYALCALEMLGALEKGVATDCEAFLRENAAATGLPSHPGHPANIRNCFWGVVAASVVADPRSVFGTAPLGFLSECRRPDGSYAAIPDQRLPGDLQSTVEAALIQTLLRDPPPGSELEAIRHFLSQCRGVLGQFGDRPGRSGSPRDSVFGSVGLYLLCGEPPQSTGTLSLGDLWQAHASVAVHVAATAAYGRTRGLVS